MQSRLVRPGHDGARFRLEPGASCSLRPRVAEHRPARRFLRALAAASLLLWASRAVVGAEVLTQHNDNGRTGVNAAETVLTSASVKPDRFGRLWTLYADGQVSAQPLYVSQLHVDTATNPNTPLVRGTFNAVVVATMHNTVYLYDADRENRLPDGRTRPLWATWLGPPRPGGKDVDMWSTNDPEWGILATPVIDAQKSSLWVVAWHAEGGTFRYRLHTLNLEDGAPRLPSIVIGGLPPDPANPCAYPSGYNPCYQKQRPALLLSEGVLYVAFGGDGNRGSVFAYDAASLQQVAFWASTPTGSDGGIWQSGQGPAADAAGNVYLVTGNGTFDANSGGANYGDSFVRLRLEDGKLVVKDYFTPCNERFLSGIDLDLGSGGPVLVPGTDLLLSGGKQGIVYLLSRSNLGKFAASPTAPDCRNPNAVQELQATDLHVHGAGTTWGHIHGSPVVWTGPDRTRVYLWGENDTLKAYRLENGRFVDIDQPRRSTYRPPQGMPGGMLTVSSNGTQPGSGIVWAVVPLDGDANKTRGVQGIVLALDAQDVSRQLWTSEQSGPRDRLGLFAKFAPPTVAGGKVFVATYGDKEALRVYGGNARPQQPPARYYVAVYGPLPHPPHLNPIVNQARDDVTVIAASATSALVLGTDACPPADPGNVDCTALLGQRFDAPSLHTLIVPADYDFAGCNLLRVTTASKQTGLANAAGIGWYSAEATAGSLAMNAGRYVPKSELKQVGEARLRNGAPALLHEFVAVANCPVGQGSFDRVFKPYMQFDNAADGNIYRNWDLAQNYRISRAFPQFDRSGDVLRP